MSFDTMFPYTTVTLSAGLKKFATAAAAADSGDSQAIVVAPSRPTFTAWEVGSVRLVNRSGSVALVGLGVRYANSAWVAGQVTSAGAYTDATAAAQETTTNDVTLYNHLITDGNGFLVGATELWNLLALIGSTAGNQTTPALKLEAWTGAAWLDITGAILYQDNLVTGTGEKLILFARPANWVKGGSGTNVPQTTYNLRVTFTTAGQGTTDPLAGPLFVGMARFLTDAVADGAQAAFPQQPAVRFPKVGAALHPLFTVAALDNYCEVQYRSYQ